MNSYNDFYKEVSPDCNIHGEIVKRSRYEYTYNYDPYCVYKSEKWSSKDSGDYSDRLMQWDYNKFTNCMKEVWGERCGQYFDNKEPKDIEKFLSLYYEKNLELTGIEKACNVSNGYPYWIFYYKEK